MPETTFDPTPDAPSPEQVAAEAAALEQGEKIAQMQEEDRERAFQQSQDESEDAALIGGKFKSQDDLLKAYEELQRKLGSGEKEEEVEGEVEEQPAEEPEVELSAADSAVRRASEAYDSSGELSEESIEELSKLDSKELIKAYLTQYKAKTAEYQAAQLQQAEVVSLVNDFGGQEKYNEMVTWAGKNLSPEEVQQYNIATSSNAASARFAMQALKARYEASEGYEADLVTGRKPKSALQPYRSNAELARDINNPKYQTDPAFRQDVEARLARSTDLL